ncbi:hypothetical protein ZOSMA_220G00100 [Zostera marina]|uniref:Uncharacterized protein n=1 Tax=Zostera marina TaxID=29655 RepID=A0A0K9PJL1_ZOSMR|nr:hypothetical protein ZOSMA_220G00100 [Zostera marina]
MKPIPCVNVLKKISSGGEDYKPDISIAKYSQFLHLFEQSSLPLGENKWNTTKIVVITKTRINPKTLRFKVVSDLRSE